MNGITWNFRDLTIHLFPGTLVTIVIFYILNDASILVIEETAIFVFYFLIISYLVGFTVDATTVVSNFSNKIIRKIMKDPLSGLFVKAKEEKRFGFNELSFAIIQHKFGAELVKAETSASLIYYMVRKIEFKNETLANFISRISSLENMCKNISYSLFINVIILFFYFVTNFDRNLIFAMFVSFVFAAVMIVARDRKRNWFGRVVTRSFIAINQDLVENVKVEKLKNNVKT